jgi:O-antigen ligase
MTAFIDEPILLIFGAVLFFYFAVLSLKFPMICAAIYPFSFLSFTQTAFSVGGISPSKYLGVVLIFVGMIHLLKETHSGTKRNYSFLALFCLIMLFPIWILIRFLVEGSEMNLAFTFMLNALTTFAIVVIVNSEGRKRIMEVSLTATFVLLSLGMIAAYYVPSMSFLTSIQDGGYSRTIGFANDPNYGGAFIAIGFAYFFSKAIFFFESKRRGLLLLFLLLIAISIFALFLTISRAAILSVVMCLLMTVFYGRIRIKHLAWLVPSMGILFVIFREFPALIDAIVHRISISTFDYSNVMRLEIFRTGISVIRDNMLWGVGEYSGYHNAFIDVGVFGGVIGLGFFIILIFVVFRMNMKILAFSEGYFQDMARFVLLGLIVFLSNSLFIGMETERIVWYLFGWGMINFILFRKAQQSAVLLRSQPPELAGA